MEELAWAVAGLAGLLIARLIWHVMHINDESAAQQIRRFDEHMKAIAHGYQQMLDQLREKEWELLQLRRQLADKLRQDEERSWSYWLAIPRWQFPADPFFEWEPQDEPLCRLLGIGHEVKE